MTDVLVPGGRDVRATLEGPEDARACVVACPPHPRHGGHRGDRRLRAVSDALAERGIACLRFDYGDWDEGVGEREDARNAVRWARDRYDRVGVFGYSFGAAIALGASASLEGGVAAISVLAPPARITAAPDATAALESLGCPVQVLYGERDRTVDWEPVVDRARELVDDGRPLEVVALSADHHFVGQDAKVADAAGAFLGRTTGG